MTFTAAGETKRTRGSGAIAARGRGKGGIASPQVVHLKVLLWLEGSVAEPLGPGADGDKHQPEKDGRPEPGGFRGQGEAFVNFCCSRGNDERTNNCV